MVFFKCERELSKRRSMTIRRSFNDYYDVKELSICLWLRLITTYSLPRTTSNYHHLSLLPLVVSTTAVSVDSSCSTTLHAPTVFPFIFELTQAARYGKSLRGKKKCYSRVRSYTSHFEKG